MLRFAYYQWKENSSLYIFSTQPASAVHCANFTECLSTYHVSCPKLCRFLVDLELNVYKKENWTALGYGVTATDREKNKLSSHTNQDPKSLVGVHQEVI